MFYGNKDNMLSIAEYVPHDQIIKMISFNKTHILLYAKVVLITNFLPFPSDKCKNSSKENGRELVVRTSFFRE